LAHYFKPMTSSPEAPPVIDGEWEVVSDPGQESPSPSDPPRLH